MNSTAQSLTHLAMIAIVPAAICALAISCCPAEAQSKLVPEPIFELEVFERDEMWACLSTRSAAGYDNYESPSARLDYCIAQIKNYRSLK